MWKLPPAKIQLNVCQMVARDEKLVYSKLQPPKSRFEGMREKIKKKFSVQLLFLNSTQKSLILHGISAHVTLSQAMWFGFFGAIVNFLRRTKLYVIHVDYVVVFEVYHARTMFYVVHVA